FIKTYQYDNNGIYIGDVDEWVTTGTGVSAGATSVAPPAVESGYVAVFSANTWSMVVDNRGKTVYSTTDRLASTVDYVGPINEGFTTLKPSTDYDVWTDGSWVTDTTAQKNAEITAAKNTQSELLSDAKNTISIWQTELSLGNITDADKTSLTTWINYIKELQEIDVNNPMDITWPDKPV
ncbi:tail fiber assembly protein, partial [Martelella alba]